MKKITAGTILGAALLAAGGTAYAEQNRPAEQRWEVRQGQNSDSIRLDLARWLARRLNEGNAIPLPVPPAASPKSAPVTGPMPHDDGDAICPPERVHCPMG